MDSPPSRYHRLPVADDQENNEGLPSPRSQTWQSISRGSAFLGSLLASFLMGIAASSIVSEYRSQGELCQSEELWNPGLATALDRQWVKFKGGLFEKSPYRGTPNTSIDSAWERYTESPWFDGGAVVSSVSEGDIDRARKHNDSEWFNSTVNLGNVNGGGYMGTLEIFHQLHCLDMIRRYIYPEFYSLDEFRTRKEFMRDHIDHCIDMILQALMCFGDTGLVTFHWVEDARVPVPDFNTWHQCRDPEAILRWAKEHEAPMQQSLLKPDDAVEMPSLW